MSYTCLTEHSSSTSVTLGIDRELVFLKNTKQKSKFIKGNQQEERKETSFSFCLLSLLGTGQKDSK